MITEPEGTDEELHALVADAISVGDVARRYARLYGGEASTVHASVEATLHVLEHCRQVEGSTPMASPARVGICGDSAPQIFPNTVPVVCSLPHGHAGWHHADGGGDWTERAPADEPAPVPPPVDAPSLLDIADASSRAQAAHRQVARLIRERAYADGVAEGRRLLDETAATAAVHAYELGIAEGRRQATEERTEEKIRIDVSLDSPEYRRQLLKMIRTGEIVLPEADRD